MNNVYVIGVGMTRFGKLLELSIKDLTREVVEAALKDAGLERQDIDTAVFGNSTQGHMEGQQMIRGEIALRAMGIESIPVINVENACATASTALHVAVSRVRSGESDVALAVGVDKMFSRDKARMFSIFDSGWDISATEASKERLLKLGQGLEIPPGTTSDKPYSVFMDIYAAGAREHMKRYGTTQRQIAAVSAKNHTHSRHNPLAQYQVPMTVEEVLAAPPITYPLTMPMCSPVSDGAAAAIVCSERVLDRLLGARSRAIRVMATVLQTGSEAAALDDAKRCTALASKRAYELAGIGPKDVNVVELHDATAMGEIIQIENLGLCGKGEGGPYTESGATTIGGQVPVNPSGGLESKGHPIGATGLAQVYELVQQLRGECGARQVQGARIALAENGGGLIGSEEAVACITILGR